jgi:hypothetical protein
MPSWYTRVESYVRTVGAEAVVVITLSFPGVGPTLSTSG